MYIGFQNFSIQVIRKVLMKTWLYTIVYCFFTWAKQALTSTEELENLTRLWVTTTWKHHKSFYSYMVYIKHPKIFLWVQFKFAGVKVNSEQSIRLHSEIDCKGVELDWLYCIFLFTENEGNLHLCQFPGPSLYGSGTQF